MLRAILTVLLAFFCFALALPPLMVGLIEREATPMSCANFDPSTARVWLSLDSCRLSWKEAGFARVGSTVTEVYVPLRATHQGDMREPIALVLASRRPAFLALGEALYAAQEGEGRLEGVLDTHQQLMDASETYSGLTRPRHALSSHEEAIIGALPSSHSPQLLVMDDASTPDLMSGVTFALAGFALLALAALQLRRSPRIRPPD